MTDSKKLPPEPEPAMRPGTTAPVKPSSSRRPQFGAAALAVLFYALLVDAAVETFLSGAPVRWWVAGVVAAYLGLIALVWRASGDRFRWWTRATASSFVLLGVLALTAWLPGGLTNGVAMLRQPTSIVLSAVSALAVAVAGLVLVRVRSLPWWGRAALGFLALYGVSAFVVGIIDGTPYPDLFQGESLWRRLPYWLQGAFIGALATVPVAVVVRTIEALKHLRAAAGRKWGVQQSIALSLSVVMAISGFTAAGPAEPQPLAAQITEPLLVSAFKGPVGAQSTELPTALKRLAALSAQIDRREFDVDALAASLPPSVDQVFAFVRDSIAYEAYEGVMRSAEGTLLARAGNSYDKSLLLAALLARKGFRVRFTSGRLATERAEVLLGHMFDETRTTGAPPTEGAMAAAAGISGAEAERRVKTFGNDAWGARFRDLVSESLTTTQRLVGQGTRASEFDVRSTIQDHTWVQVNTDGKWVDLDPSFRNGRVGDRHADALDLRDSLAPERSWRFKLAIRAVQQRGADRRDKSVGEWSWAVADVLTSRVHLLVVPASSRGSRLFTAKDLDESERFIPIVRINDQTQNGELFTLAGEVGAEVTNPAAVVGSRIGDMLGGRRTGSDPTSSQLPFLESITANYVLVSPSGSENVESRFLYQRASQGRSAAELSMEKVRLLGSYQIQISAGRIPSAYVLYRLSDSIAANRPFLDIAGGLRPAPPAEQLGAALGEFREDPLQLLVFAHLSAFSHLKTLDKSGRYRYYLSQPNVVTYKRRALGWRGGTYVLEEGFDVVHDAIEVVSRAGRSDEWCFEMRMRRGIFVSALELGLHPDAARAFGALNVLQEARRAGVALKLVGPKDVGRLKEFPLAQEDRERIDRFLRSGGRVILPERPIVLQQRARMGWIRIDGHGNLLAMSEGGGGQVAVEKGMLTAALIGQVLGLLAGLWGCRSQGLSVSQCVVNVVCQMFLGAIFGVLVFAASGGITYALNALLTDAAFHVVFEWELFRWAIFAAIFGIIRNAICSGITGNIGPNR